MSEVVRISVSLEGDLLEAFDRYVENGRYATRSEAVRQLVREKLTAVTSASDNAEVAASLTLVYDHHRPRLTQALVDAQHEAGVLVISAMHVHLTHDLCMELIALRGPAREVERLAGELGGMKGIHQAQLVVVHAAAEGPAHGHHHPHPHPHPHG
ncbi:MAG: nickel-responsive transcriptional regulator NikR [Gemmataceae bacterium]|nr:nickel-responsive transcriptional regulator NikR [Gemmataceae bacterium]